MNDPTPAAAPTLQQVEQAIRAAIDTGNGPLIAALEPVCDTLDLADKQHRAAMIMAAQQRPPSPDPA